MINRIIADGTSGAGFAALDLAIKMDLQYGGYCCLPVTISPATARQYRLRTVSNRGARSAAEMNIEEANGLLLIARGEPEERLRRLITLAEQSDCPHLFIDLDQLIAFDAAQEINSWIESFNVSSVYVTGTKSSADSDLYRPAAGILETAIYMGFIEKNTGRSTSFTGIDDGRPPASVDEAVARLTAALPLKDRATIANMTLAELVGLQPNLGNYILKNFALWSGNPALMESCRFVSKQKTLDENGATRVIIQELWKQLSATHKLRLV